MPLMQRTQSNAVGVFDGNNAHLRSVFARINRARAHIEDFEGCLEAATATRRPGRRTQQTTRASCNASTSS